MKWAGAPTRPSLTFEPLLGAALTLVLAQAAHSETSMMDAMTMLKMPRLCFMATITSLPLPGLPGATIIVADDMQH